MCWVLWLLFTPHDNPARYNAFHIIVIWGSEKWKDSAKDTNLKVAKPNCEHTSFEFKSMAFEHLTTLLVWVLPEKPYHCPTRIWGNWHLSKSPFPHWLRFPLRWIPLKCEADRCKEMSQGQWTQWAWRDWPRVSTALVFLYVRPDVCLLAQSCGILGARLPFPLIQGSDPESVIGRCPGAGFVQGRLPWMEKQHVHRLWKAGEAYTGAFLTGLGLIESMVTVVQE